MKNPNLRSWDTIRSSLGLRDMILLELSLTPVRWKIVDRISSNELTSGTGIKAAREAVRRLWWNNKG